MGDPFPITFQQLAHDSLGKRVAFLLLSAALVAAWIAWSFLARVAVYTITDQARVEVAQAVYSIQAPVSGRVTKSNLELGRKVESGEVLVELEDESQKLKIAEEQKHAQTLAAQKRDLNTQLAAEQRALAADREEQESATAEARDKIMQAQVAKQLTDDQVRDQGRLLQEGLISKWDYQRLKADARQKALDLEAAQKVLTEVEKKGITEVTDRQSRIASIESDVHKIEGDQAASADASEELNHELRRYTIRAPGWGRLDSIVSVKPGTYIHEGDRLGAIVPQGQYRIVADFDPSDAIGLVHPGQSASLRLAGFPWAEYGSIGATVRTVGSEVRDGRVRVELEPNAQRRLPLQHGLPGSVEIITERISPALLLVRQAGGYLGQIAGGSAANSQAANGPGGLR
jgi:multidrug resistance efflux pump